MEKKGWINNRDGYSIIKNIITSVRENRQYLSELDGKTGDGDHGVNMSKGFAMAEERLEEGSSLAEGFFIIGETLLMEIGGSMGPIYGIFFKTMHEYIKDMEHIDAYGFMMMLREAVESTVDICGAQPGDKTLIDTLVPALNAFESSLDQRKTFSIALADMKDAAKEGMNSTKDMMAKKGRSARLGERSVGVLDAGAVSCYIILNSMAESALSLLENEES